MADVVQNAKISYQLLVISYQKEPKTENGFTIIEILIAVVILGVGLAGIIALFPVAMDIHSKATALRYSVYIAKSVESAIKTGRNQTDSTSTSFAFIHDGTDGSTITVNLPTDDAEYRYPSDSNEVYTIGESIPEEEREKDPSRRYSFCFYVKRSPRDPINVDSQHCNTLYEFAIYVYRNFKPNAENTEIKRYKFNLKFK